MKRTASLLMVLAMLGPAAAQPASIDGLLAKTDVLARQVAKLRGLRLKQAIPNDVVDRDELRRRLVAVMSEEKQKRQIAGDALMLARWGLIPPGTDYATLMIDLLADQIAGYYDSDTKKLTIARGAVDDLAWTELVLAHELAHGLQDQAFDLTKFEEAASDDSAVARRALVEGDALAVMIELMLSRQGQAAPWSNPEVAASIQKGMSVPGGGDSLDRAPLAVREGLMFPYRAGLGFVAALRRRQPWSAVNAAFARPPRSSEQVLHPERYARNDEPITVEVTLPPSLAGFTVAHSTVWGELGLDTFLRTHGVDAKVAAIAAEGWGGDRIVTLVRSDRPTRTVGLGRLTMDTEPDAIEAVEAMTKALDHAMLGATIERSPLRTRWLALDGTVGWIERDGASFVVAIGVPVWAVDVALGE